MKKLTLIVLLAGLVMAVPALAKPQDKYALGNMYTQALNAMESSGMLTTLESEKTVVISDIHMDHGQVFVTLRSENEAVILVYDPIAGKVLPGKKDAK